MSKKEPFAYNLKNARIKAELTQQDLANKAELKRSNIGAYEEGRAEPCYKDLIKICDILRRDVRKMIESPIPELWPETK